MFAVSTKEKRNTSISLIIILKKSNVYNEKETPLPAEARVEIQQHGAVSDSI